MTIYRVYDSWWGEDSNVKYYLREETALEDYQNRGHSSCYMDAETVITD